MTRLTTKAKIAVQFSIFLTLFILVSSTIFTVVYYVLIDRNIKDTLLQESKEIVGQYLVFDQNRLIYQKNKNNTLLSEHLRYDNASAIIYTEKEEVIGAFGIFQDKTNNNPQKEFVSKVIESKQYLFTNTSTLYEDRQYEVISYPIIFKDKAVGVIQIAKETNFISTLFRTYLLLLATLLPLGILGSWILVYVVSVSSFRPITNLANTMNEISMYNLHKKVSFKGNKNDELYKLSETFNSMMDRIKLGFERQQEFVANASHELKTPLTRAISSLEVLTLKKIYQEDLTIINETKNELFKLNNILKNLLFLSKTNIHESVGYQEFSIANEIQKILTTFQKDIEKKHLKIDLLKIAPIMITFPKDYFQILISNLISNAIKYSYPEGKIVITTNETPRSNYRDIFSSHFVGAKSSEAKYSSLSSPILRSGYFAKEDKQDNQITINVTDEGIGMTAEEKQHLFDRFYRGKSVSSKTEGSGLGMSIVKTITDLYNLNVKVSSVKGKGTTISLSNFPIVTK